MVKMNGCAAIDFRPSVSLFGRQGGGCRRFPFGKCPKPLNDFKEIGCAPAELNSETVKVSFIRSLSFYRILINPQQPISDISQKPIDL